jgi:hypothetical protein
MRMMSTILGDEPAAALKGPRLIIMLHDIFIRCGLLGQVQRTRSCHGWASSAMEPESHHSKLIHSLLPR